MAFEKDADFLLLKHQTTNGTTTKKKEKDQFLTSVKIKICTVL